MSGGFFFVKLNFSHYRDLFRTYLSPQKGQVLILALLIFANLALQLLIPQIMRSFIDSVISGTELTFLVRLGALFLGTALIQQLLAISSAY